VEERLSDSNLSVEDLAADMGLSRVQLYRKVKALTGCTPIDLLRKARLAQAQMLLQESTLTVSEIAYKVGFASPSYFTKCYKDEFGTVPGEARKTN
jgi:AraC-like DNA-binding protein